MINPNDYSAGEQVPATTCSIISLAGIIDATSVQNQYFVRTFCRHKLPIRPSDGNRPIGEGGVSSITYLRTEKQCRVLMIQA
jgi:hypothetical protein